MRGGAPEIFLSPGARPGSHTCTGWRNLTAILPYHDEALLHITSVSREIHSETRGNDERRGMKFLRRREETGGSKYPREKGCGRRARWKITIGALEKHRPWKDILRIREGRGKREKENKKEKEEKKERDQQSYRVLIAAGLFVRKKITEFYCVSAAFITSRRVTHAYTFK